MRGDTPCPTPTRKQYPEADPPDVYKLSLFGQPLGSFSVSQSLVYLISISQRLGGAGGAGQGGLAFWLLDLCGQLGCVCCALVVCTLR